MRNTYLLVLYRIFDSTGRLLYVGATTNPAWRMAKHHEHQPWWPDAVQITLHHMKSLTELEDAEREAIRSEKPKYNVLHNGVPSTWSRRPRAPRGEGTVFQRSSDGRWIGRIEVPSADGKRKRRLVSGATQAEAKLKLEELKRDLGLGL